jgi:arsenate reductase (thioredoxin)
MTGTPRTVLFLCTGNSARSILAESLLNHMGEGRFRAFSAGSQPKGEPHPMALEVLRATGLPAEGLRSKSWHEFAGPDAEPIDLVITVCDNAAGETCPVWPGRTVRGVPVIAAHWGIEDPAAVEGEGQRRAFERALGYLCNRISLLLALPDDGIDALALKAIGRAEGATPSARQDA